ncbi:MAG: hypothetical protein ACR2QO_18665, partial [Acidimicrobiales bacterium]
PIGSLAVAMIDVQLGRAAGAGQEPARAMSPAEISAHVDKPAVASWPINAAAALLPPIASVQERGDVVLTNPNRIP